MIPQRSDRQPVCVSGAGISGLSAAYELHKRRIPFVLLEASSRFGGVIQTDTVDQFVIDAGPDTISTQKPGAVGLCRELSVDLSPVKTAGIFVARGGALRRLPHHARTPGLFLSAAGFRGVGIADCITDARAQATRLAASRLTQ